MAYALAFRMLGNAEDARDAAQEALLQAWIQREQLRDGEKLAPWLRQITVNVCRMAARRRREASPLPDHAAAGDQTQPAVMRIAVEQALTRLSEEHKLALTLFYLKQYSLKEIADFLDVPETTIKSRLRGARLKLRDEWTAMTEQVLLPAPLPDGFEKTLFRLFEAAGAGDADTIAQMLRRDPALVHARDFFGATVVTTARRAGHKALTDDLVERSGPLSLADAAEAGDITRVRVLLGSDPGGVDAVSPAGFTPLCLAAHYGHAGIVELLIQSGANIDRIASHAVGVAPLHSCLFARRFDIARLLVRLGADVNLRRTGTPDQERTGWTALHYAASYDESDLLRFLLDHGGDPAMQDARGRTPCDVARERHAERALALLENRSRRAR
jgi:RNA polymerase sigma factor (sigma-70 family)